MVTSSVPFTSHSQSDAEEAVWLFTEVPPEIECQPSAEGKEMYSPARLHIGALALPTSRSVRLASLLLLITLFGVAAVVSCSSKQPRPVRSDAKNSIQMKQIMPPSQALNVWLDLLRHKFGEDPIPSTTVTTTGRLLSCGLIEHGFSYPGNDLFSLPGIISAEECCQRCADEVECLAWTWGMKRGMVYSDVCYLKGDQPRKILTKVRDDGFTSGQPTQVQKFIQAMEPNLGQSIFCFSLMMPFGYEQSLLAFQYMKGASIFSCDEYAVYSNKTLEVAPGVMTSLVLSDLHCEFGGEFKTALNTDIFLAVWDRLIRDGRFKFHDWTAKVDPDAVFFPERLRYTLLSHGEAPGGVYLNNCQLGMHGPLEVLSRNAVAAWSMGRSQCIQHFNQLCSGPCLWGEDLFVDQCLEKVLNVRRDNDWNLLIEDHCEPPAGWQTCQHSKTVAAFHPFKTVEGYQQCLHNAIS